MSGGSYEYLYIKDLMDILGNDGHIDTLESMYERLKQLGYAEKAAEDTLTVLNAVRELKRRIYDMESDGLGFSLNALREIWHDVEWFDSCDYGEDTVKESLETYRNSR